MMKFAKTLTVVAATCALCSIAACKTNSIAATTNNTSDVIGPAGGMLKGADGEELLVPAGALTVDTTFTLSVAQPGSGSYPASAPSGLQYVGDVFEYQPHGTQFLTPATVIIPYTTTPTTATLLQAEEGATSWTTVAISGMQTGAVEGAVSTLSYFVVADAGTATVGTNNTCSGRAPVAGAPTAAATSGMTGTIPAMTDGSNTMYPAVDLSTVLDGYATKGTGTGVNGGGPETTYSVGINLTTYAQACGYQQNSDSKIGSSVGTIAVASFSPITTQAYVLGAVSVFTNGIPSSTAPGMCALSANASASEPFTTGDTALTITAIDDSHVAGNFNFTPNGGTTPLVGTFDVPFCAAAPSGLVDCCLQ